MHVHEQPLLMRLRLEFREGYVTSCVTRHWLRRYQVEPSSRRAWACPSAQSWQAARMVLKRKARREAGASR